MIANVHEAKSQLSKLLDAAERGEEVIITRRGNGVNRFQLVPVQQKDWSDLIGAMKGQIHFADDYDLADAEILADFEEGFARDERLGLDK